MAILIFAMFILGWLAASWPLSPTKLRLFFWHKSLGITLLALATLRLLWRWRNSVPAAPAGTPSWQQGMASTSHKLLYILMIAIPLSGWVINSAANFPFKVFGWFTLPSIAPHDKTIQSVAQVIHLSGFWLIITILLIHIGAAFWHHRYHRNEILTRMLPFRK